MPLHLSAQQIALRLALAFIGGALVGLNRDERGHSAGLRTNLLVCLAACIAMIQANLLNTTTGKAPDSFVVMDTMRLPLGILSGIGFIGAGAILKRGEMIVGVTTAATLWFVTVMGLCFGGGQLRLGLAALVLGLVTLTVLKKAERVLPRHHRARLSITMALQDSPEEQIRERLSAAGLETSPVVVRHDRRHEISYLELAVRWKDSDTRGNLLSMVNELQSYEGVLKVNARRQE